ncbi:hypothetical protein O181_023415 [Austropuccinia psidii MF-1]|uniref:CDC20/Fizzy WD40 domain-containing protein n=1 Tax=Austropuccinia psidii MF-1 TaxID=1389203 RepID=A0A9Q3GZ24_9BASI|nr:hypothetical protein [Austropuccinia psidii MF-1]
MHFEDVHCAESFPKFPDLSRGAHHAVDRLASKNFAPPSSKLFQSPSSSKPFVILFATLGSLGSQYFGSSFTMAPSPTKRHTISNGVNPLLSNFSMMSLDQLGPPGSRSKHSSNVSPSKVSKNSASLRPQKSQLGLGQTSSSVHKILARPMNRDEVLGRDLVRKDWGSSPTKKTHLRKAASVDRYITRDIDSCPLDAHLRENVNNHSGESSHATELSSALGIDLNRRILSFTAEVPSSSRASREREDPIAKERVKASALGSASTHHRRQVPTIPERVLDAPGLIDDYYLNLTDWSVDNILAIALGECIYLWNAQTGNVSLLCSLDENSYYASVKFSNDGNYLALGTSEGAVHIYDVAEARLLRKMLGRECRVPTLSWSGTILSAGGLDGSIWNHDVQAARHKSSEMIGHRAEVCGLAWKPEADDGLSTSSQGLLASGANDNIVNVWDARNVDEPRMSKNNHRAAVKAIAWCPWQSNLLATGGGTSDKMVHFWNVNTSSRLQSLETRSQVTSIVFNPYSREFLTTHGLPDMHFSIYTFPNFQVVADIPKAHDTRILHSALSPDGCIVVTASSDENLKFWRVFENKRAKVGSSGVFGKAYPLGSKDQNQQQFKSGYELLDGHWNLCGFSSLNEFLGVVNAVLENSSNRDSRRNVKKVLWGPMQIIWLGVVGVSSTHHHFGYYLPKDLVLLSLFSIYCTRVSSSQNDIGSKNIRLDDHSRFTPKILKRTQPSCSRLRL